VADELATGEVAYSPRTDATACYIEMSAEMDKGRRLCCDSQRVSVLFIGISRRWENRGDDGESLRFLKKIAGQSARRVRVNQGHSTNSSNNIQFVLAQNFPVPALVGADALDKSHFGKFF